MNKLKGKLGQYEVRLTTVATTTTTWVIFAKDEAHAEKRMRTMNVGLLHDSQTDWDSFEEEVVTVNHVTSLQEVGHE